MSHSHTLRTRRTLLAVGVTGLLVLGACSDSDDGGDAGPASTIATTNADTSGPTAVVEAGDTLSGIAASYGLTLDELIEANGWSDGADHAIFPGDEVQLPAGASPVATTNRPTTAGASSSGDRPTTTAASATTAVPDEVEYVPTGSGTGAPDFGDETDPVSTPLSDGVYWAWHATLSADGGSVEFTLSQVFFGDACREVYGTSPEACASDIGSDESTQAPVSLEVGTGTASVMLMDDSSAFTFYRVPTTELARLLAGDPPSPGAPDGLRWTESPFVVTVRNGVAVAADQVFVS